MPRAAPPSAPNAKPSRASNAIFMCSSLSGKCLVMSHRRRNQVQRDREKQRRHSGAMRSIEPGISRFRVWSFGPSRNDELARSRPAVEWSDTEAGQKQSHVVPAFAARTRGCICARVGFNFQTATDTPSHSRGADSARSYAICDALESRRAQGKPGALSTRSRVHKMHTGDHRCAGTPGLPCAMVLRLIPRSPRRRIRLATVADGLAIHESPVGPCESPSA